MYNPATSSYSTNWAYMRVTGEKGTPGEGKTGLWYCYAGVWDDNGNGDVSSSSGGVKNTDRIGYYVKYGNNFYMNIAPANTSNTNTPGGANWVEMQSDFKYIITKAVFSDYAQLGSFIINGDWFISKEGKKNGAWSDDYTSFNPSTFPNSGFIPNIAIDARTGKTYFNDTYIKGEVNATSGSFTGTITSTNATFSGQLLIQQGNSDGLKLDSNGNILRYSSLLSSWVPMFAGRAVRIESRAGGSTPKSLYATDDFILFSSTDGWWETPSSVENGKVLTMRNINGGTNTIRPASGQRIRDFDGWHTHSDQGRNINNDERVEMVYYNNVWYLNVIGS